MVTVHLGPSWFFGADAILEGLAALIAFCVTLASFKVWKITKVKKYGVFTTSFALLTLSFLARAITDTLVEGIIYKVPQEYIAKVFFLGYVTHILLALIAYVTLLVVTHNITDRRITALIYFTLIPSLLLSGSYFLSFYGLSAIFLAFITVAYYHNYKKVCKATACLVFISFLIITASQVLFLLEAVYDPLYVIAHVTQALGYLTLLFALIKALLR